LQEPISCVFPSLLPRNSPPGLLFSRKRGKCGEWVGRGTLPVEKPRAGKRLRKKKRSTFKRSEFCVSSKRASLRGKRLFTGAPDLPHFFRRGKKWGIASVIKSSLTSRAFFAIFTSSKGKIFLRLQLPARSAAPPRGTTTGKSVGGRSSFEGGFHRRIDG